MECIKQFFISPIGVDINENFMKFNLYINLTVQLLSSICAPTK